MPTPHERAASTLLARLTCATVTCGALLCGASPALAQTQAPVQEDQSAMRAQAEAGMRQHYLTRTAQYAQDTMPRQVVMLGDSLTEGIDWSAVFPGVTIANRGIGGDSTKGMLDRLSSVTDLKPKKIFIMAGINDLSWYGWAPAEVFNRYKQMIDTLAKSGAKLYVQSTLMAGPAFPPATNVAVADLNTRLRDYCRRGHCHYIDLNPLLAPQGALSLDYTVDHLHLNAAGYEKWAQAIRKPLTGH
ncbi:MAG: hypothetical protein EOO27_32680 [Comamonadaceae bacterium]|nr:MAG: hypothetical protein EOO27_32680 [Comamonadaceae bacterium]